MKNASKELQAAQKRVDVAGTKVVAAQLALQDAERERDVIVEAQAESDSQLLAHSVQAYQESQKKFRKSRFAKREKIAKLIEEVA